MIQLDLEKISLPGLDLERPIIIAGPCSAETEEQTLATAHQLAAKGFKIFRAGIWKPRTKPGGFEGVGSEGLQWLRRVKEETGLTMKNPRLVGVKQFWVKSGRYIVFLFSATKFSGEFKKDSLSSIQLTSYKPNQLKYVSNNSSEGFAVFSEMYYKNGWKATIDGKEAEILNVNYVLRGLQIPAGKHTIEFKFEPEVVKTGSTIALMSSIGMLLLIGAGVYFERKKKIQD